MTTRNLVLLLLFLLLLGSARADELVPAKELGTLERTARDLAKAGLGREAGVLIEVLTELGFSEKALARLTAAREKYGDEGGAKALAKQGPRAAKTIAKEVGKLAAHLETVKGEDRARLAEALLRLDHDCPAAHEALGRKLVSGRYISKELEGLEAGRAKIAAALQEVSRLKVEMELGDKPHPVIEMATGRPGTMLTIGRDFELHGTLSEDRLRRILREAVQTSAFANYLLTGKAVPPGRRERLVYVQTRSRLEYEKMVNAANELGFFESEEKHKLALDLDGAIIYQTGTTLYLDRALLEGDVESTLAMRLIQNSDWPGVTMGGGWFGFAQPCLITALMNYACLARLGKGLPALVAVDKTKGTAGRTVAGPALEKDQLQILYPKCGLAGHMRRLIYLIEQDRDPPWVSTMVDRMAKIEGDDLIKATSVIQFLAEEKPLLPLFLETWPKSRDFEPGTPRPQIEKALGAKIEDVERRWRDWILPPGTGSLVGRLRGGGGGDAEPSPLEKEAVAVLNAVRKEAGQPKVGSDPVLSAGCLRHAQYLELNREQLALWPEAHEEFPDKEGFSTGGAWAGGHAVIYPEVKGPAQAIDGWMGTFYHRLPLIHPGLLMIGYGQEDGTAVLDCSSLVAPPYEEQIHVAWPPDGMKGVSPVFTPELPNPVPGQEQAALGTAVTLQVWWWEDEMGRDIEMSLHLGTAKGPVVDCHFSTPGNPTNPDLAPKSAWCLLPKNHLSKGQKYTVVATVLPDDTRIVWSFTTGS